MLHFHCYDITLANIYIHLESPDIPIKPNPNRAWIFFTMTPFFMIFNSAFIFLVDSLQVEGGAAYAQAAEDAA